MAEQNSHYEIEGVRNPLIRFSNGRTIGTSGDAHLGRKYVNGVPFDKDGEIEKLQRKAFEETIDVDCDVMVQMGDIFDKFLVDNLVVLYVLAILLAVQSKHKKRILVLIRGNHDDHKDVDKVSSFDVLVALLKPYQESHRIYVVEDRLVYEDLMFCGWSPVKNSVEVLEGIGKEAKFAAVFGHWDINIPSHVSTFNLVPTEVLKQHTNLIVTGHDHKPGVLERDGITIVKTGSVIPLAHGEELEDDALIYTIKLEDYDPEVHQNKIVRFILDEDEEVPEGEFLQVKVIPKVKKEAETESETEIEKVDGSLDLPDLLSSFLTKNGVNDTLAATVVERFKASNAE